MAGENNDSRSKCGWFDIGPGGKVATCNNEATHIGDCDMPTVPVCAAHACRAHAMTFAERARRDEMKRIPSHWMAL